MLIMVVTRLARISLHPRWLSFVAISQRCSHVLGILREIQLSLGRNFSLSFSLSLSLSLSLCLSLSLSLPPPLPLSFISLFTHFPYLIYRSGDSTARIWRLGDGQSHDSPIVLPHEPVGSTSQECNRDVTTVHWNVSWNYCLCRQSCVCVCVCVCVCMCCVWGCVWVVRGWGFIIMTSIEPLS